MPTRNSKGSNQTGFTFRRLAGDRVQVTGRLSHKSARYEVDGVIDVGRRRVEPFRSRLTLNGQRVFDSILSVAPAVVRTEFTFGNATEGARRLVLRTEPLQRGAVVTGFADDVEILPMVSTGCSCHSRAERKRSVFGWAEDGTASRVTVRLKPAKQAGDLEGLAEAGETSIARLNNGGFGDIFGDIMTCIDYALCLLMCGLEYLWCLVDAVGNPAPDIFVELCSVLSGGCTTLCHFESTFP